MGLVLELSIDNSYTTSPPLYYQVCDDSNQVKGFAVIGVATGLGRIKVRPHLQPNPDPIYMNSVRTKVLTYKSRSIVDH